MECTRPAWLKRSYKFALVTKIFVVFIFFFNEIPEKKLLKTISWVLLLIDLAMIIALFVVQYVYRCDRLVTHNRLLIAVVVSACSSIAETMIMLFLANGKNDSWSEGMLVCTGVVMASSICNVSETVAIGVVFVLTILSRSEQLMIESSNVNNDAEKPRHHAKKKKHRVHRRPRQHSTSQSRSQSRSERRPATSDLI